MIETAEREQREAERTNAVLTALAEAAREVTARSVTARGAADRAGRNEILVVRHSGTAGVQQAVALCRRLAGCETPARVIASAEVAAVLHARAPGGAGIAAVIDLDPADVRAGAALAAEFGVLLLVPARADDEPRPAPRSCDAMSIAVPGDNGAAAWQADIVPHDSGGSVTIEVAGRVVQVRDALVQIRVRPQDGLLEVTAGPRSARHHLRGSRVQIESVDGAHDVVRDGARRTPLSGLLVLQSWRRSVNTLVVCA